MSPWSESGQFCGSRGMALPILGFKVKLSSAAAKRFDLSLSATFLDGTKLERLGSEDTCETPSLSALEAMRVELTPKPGAKPTGTAKQDSLKSAGPANGKATAAPVAKAVPKGKRPSKIAP